MGFAAVPSNTFNIYAKHLYECRIARDEVLPRKRCHFENLSRRLFPKRSVQTSRGIDPAAKPIDNTKIIMCEEKQCFVL